VLLVWLDRLWLEVRTRSIGSLSLHGCFAAVLLWLKTPHYFCCLFVPEMPAVQQRVRRSWDSAQQGDDPGARCRGAQAAAAQTAGSSRPCSAQGRRDAAWLVCCGSLPGLNRWSAASKLKSSLRTADALNAACTHSAVRSPLMPCWPPASLSWLPARTACVSFCP